jgi:hypothetical protein
LYNGMKSFHHVGEASVQRTNSPYSGAYFF